MADVNYHYKIYSLNNDKEPTIHFDIPVGKFSVRIDKAEWVNNLEGEAPLAKDFIEVINYILGGPSLSEEFPNETQFSLSRKIWNLNHWDKEVPDIKMPDYNSLE